MYWCPIHGSYATPTCPACARGAISATSTNPAPAPSPEGEGEARHAAERAVNRWADHMGFLGEQEFTASEMEAFRGFVAEEVRAVLSAALSRARASEMERCKAKCEENAKGYRAMRENAKDASDRALHGYAAAACDECIAEIGRMP